MIETDDRFQKLLFKIHGIPHDQELKEKIPALFEYDEFNKYKRKDRDNFIRYIIYLYDLNSELRDEYPFPDLQRRREAAAELAGFTKEGGDWPARLKKVMEYKFNDEGSIAVWEMIFRYLKIQNKPLWIELVTLEREYDENVQRRWKIVVDEKDKDAIMALEKKSKIRDDCKKILSEIGGIEERLFGEDEKLMEKVKTELPPLRPETVHKYFAY